MSGLSRQRLERSQHRFRARVELVSTGEAVAGVAWRLRTTPWDLPAAHAGYFHVTYRDHPAPVRGEDLVLLDTERVEVRDARDARAELQVRARAVDDARALVRDRLRRQTSAA